MPKEKSFDPTLRAYGRGNVCACCFVNRSELNVKVDSVMYWTDAAHILYYIRNFSLLPMLFVSNRLGKIHAFSKFKEWRYVPSDKNPADVGSCGLSP